MKILAVDTSSMAGSVALVKGHRVIVECFHDTAQTHNRRLLKIIDSILQKVKWDLVDVDLMACTSGPGSFTGVRIGLTTMKTLAWALEKPLVTVTSLQALAWPWVATGYRVCPMIDARKEEVYTAIYESSGAGEMRTLIDPCVLPPEKTLAWFTQPMVVCGDGWMTWRDRLLSQLEERVIEVSTLFQHVRASVVAEIAVKEFLGGRKDDPMMSRPVYLRPSEAEIHYPQARSHFLDPS